MSSPWSVAANASSYSCPPFSFPVQFGIDRFTPQENQWPINEDATLQLHKTSSEAELDRMSSDREAAISDKNCKEVKARCGKRKATKSLSAVSIVPAKIFVNEKHIAACISRLTLDNNNIEDQPDLEEEPWFDVEMMARRSKKPQMQLVLWKPPGGIIKNAIETLNKQKHFASDKFIVEATKSLNDQMCLLESADTEDSHI